jgi:hypothetical protein
VAWVTVDEVVVALGWAPTGEELEWLTRCTASAEAVARRKRAEAGYVDDDQVPGPDVAAGVVLYAVDLFRARGAVGDQVVGLDGPGPATVPVSGGIRTLWAIPRPGFG